MIDREYWEYRSGWLSYVNKAWSGIGRVQLVSDDSIERLEFKERAEQALKARNFPFSFVKTWVSIQKPDHGNGYADGYPHLHYPLTGLTLVHYLQPGDSPAPLDIFEGDKVVETIFPEQGLTVFMPNNLKHGARINKGTTDRIQMIATGLL